MRELRVRSVHFIEFAFMINMFVDKQTARDLDAGDMAIRMYNKYHIWWQQRRVHQTHSTNMMNSAEIENYTMTY